MGSIGNYNPSPQEQIRALPARKGSKVDVENPIYEDSPTIYMAFNELDKRAQKERQSITSTQEIYVDRIISGQQWLERNKLMDYADVNTPSPTIEVIKYHDDYIVTDGNHRVVIAKMKSQEKIKAKVIDLDKKARRK